MKKLFMILILVAVVAVASVGITLFVLDSQDGENLQVEEDASAEKEPDITVPEKEDEQPVKFPEEEERQDAEPEDEVEKIPEPENEPIFQEGSKYRIVEPTPQEIGNIYESLYPILETYFQEYNCKTEDMYQNVFKWGYFDCFIEPEYQDEVKKYISQPIEVNEDNGFEFWYELVHEEDPLGYFGKIPENAYDENGAFSYDNLEEGALVGYYRFVGEYIDWLIEGVWNNKIDHHNVIELYGESKCYYHDGFYYLPEYYWGRGGGIFVRATVRSLTPVGDNKYMLVYTVSDDLPSEDDECYGATIAMKESEEGFRFWSVFSIEKLPERSFDMKSISNEYAQYLIGNANDGIFRIFAAGFSKRELERAYRWVTDEDNIIPFTQEEKEEFSSNYDQNDLSHYTEFHYNLGIESVFYDYFRHYFTEDTIGILKTAARIEGREHYLSGIALWYDEEPYEKKVVSVDIDGDIATVTCNDGEDSLWDEEYIFKYSDIYGWQLELEKEPSISSCHTLEREYMCRNVKDFLPKKAEPIDRHPDCKNPTLTKEAALDTYLDMTRIRYVVLDFGVEEWYLSYAWATEGNGWVPDGNTDWGWHDTYLAPAVDTNEEFMAHYGQILTEESLEIMKERFHITEVDGRLIMPDMDGKHSSMIDESLSEVYLIEQDGNTAVCYITRYDVEGTLYRTEPYNFVYSEEHGWRLDCSEWY